MRPNPSGTKLARNFAAFAELGPLVGRKRLGELPALLGGLPRLSRSDVELFSADLTQAGAELRSRTSEAG